MINRMKTRTFALVLLATLAFVTFASSQPTPFRFPELWVDGNITVGGTVDGRDVSDDAALLPDSDQKAALDAADSGGAGPSGGNPFVTLDEVGALGGGTVTSVTVNGTEGILSTGSPVTGASAITLSIDESALRIGLNVEDGADVTDVTNVTAAGALMDSEVNNLSGIKTLTLPDAATISVFGATLTDDADATEALATLGADAAGTARPPTSHAHEGADIVSTGVGAAFVLTADGDNTSSWQPAGAPGAHILGGASHTADTLANLNSKVSDATLIDTADARLSDARTPTAHNHVELDIIDLGSYPDSTGQLTDLVAQTDGAGGWTFIATPTGSGTPATTVATSDASAGVVGVDTEYARQDHEHQIVTTGTPGAATPGDSAAQGSSDSLARVDHQHSLPAFGQTTGLFCEGDDSRIPTQGENDALAGTGGTPPSATNVFLTESDFGTVVDINTLLTDGPLTAVVSGAGITEPSPRPSPGVANRLYIDTSVTPNAQYRDTGAAWVVVGDGGGTEVNDLEAAVANVLDNEVFVGTGPDAGTYIALPTSGAVSFDGAAFSQAATTDLSDGATILFDADIGANVQAYSAALDAVSGSNTGDQTITLTGDVTGTGTGSFATTIAVDAVDIAMLSATGTADGTTYLRGDNTWATPSGSGITAVADIASLPAASTVPGEFYYAIAEHSHQYSNGTTWEEGGILTDGVTVEVSGSSELQVVAGGIGTTQLADGAATAAKIDATGVTDNYVITASGGAATWANIPESSVTQYVGAIDHNALQNYSSGEHVPFRQLPITSLGAPDGTKGFFFATDTRVLLYDNGSWLSLALDAEQLIGGVPDVSITESSVTQHEAALAILYSQVTGHVDADHTTIATAQSTADDHIADAAGAHAATAISYDNGTSGLTAIEVQAAIDEVVAAGGSPHTLGGSQHQSDTLANLSLKVSDQDIIGSLDARLTDERTPLDGSVTTAKIGANQVTPAKLQGTSPDGTKVYWGDGTWAVPPAGGGSGNNLAIGQWTMTFPGGAPPTAPSAGDMAALNVGQAATATKASVKYLQIANVADSPGYNIAAQLLKAKIGGHIFLQLASAPNGAAAYEVTSDAVVNGTSVTVGVNMIGSSGSSTFSGAPYSMQYTPPVAGVGSTFSTFTGSWSFKAGSANNYYGPLGSIGLYSPATYNNAFSTLSSGTVATALGNMAGGHAGFVMPASGTLTEIRIMGLADTGAGNLTYMPFKMTGVTAAALNSVEFVDAWTTVYGAKTTRVPDQGTFAAGDRIGIIMKQSSAVPTCAMYVSFKVVFD